MHRFLTCRRLVLPAAVVALTAVAGAGAAEVTPSPPPPALVVVMPDFTVVGTLDTPDSQPYQASLAEGFRKYLAEHSQGFYDVVARPMRPALGQRLLVLDGQLSHTVLDPATKDGPFLLVLRLRTVGPNARCAAQWAGTAPNLRGLTGNLDNQPGIDPEGLLGELGKRLVAAFVGSFDDQTAALDKLLSGAMHGRALELTASGEDGRTLADGATLAGGSKVTVQAAAPVPGTVYLIGRAAGGKPAALCVKPPEQAPQAGPGHPAMLPPTGAVALDTVASATGYELVVLHRLKPSSGATRDLGASDLNVGGVAVMEAGVANLATGGDPAIARLLAAAATDPDGTWSAARLKLTLTPPPPSSLWSALAPPQAKLKALEFAMDPPLAQVKVNADHVTFRAKAAKDGLLIVLDRDSQGLIHLAWPQSRKTADAALKAGQPLELGKDSGKPWQADTPGPAVVRAVLFDTAEGAEALLKLFADRLRIPEAQFVADASAWSFSSVEVGFEVMK
jgi:hypothetical protein